MNSHVKINIMNKKIFFLVLIQVCMYATTAFAQTQPCTNTINTCVQDQHVDNGTTDWHTSHGVLFFSNNNAPTSTGVGSQSLSMWSYLNTGCGAFTCYNFEKDTPYRICFWVRNNSGWPGNGFGRLYVYAANNLTSTGNSGPATLPSVSQQLIDQSYYGPPQSNVNPNTGATDWQFISVTFTPNGNYNCLWFYPMNPMGPPPPGPAQYNINYILEVDDIRVTKEPAPYNLSSSSNKDTITGCDDSVQLIISGMPGNTIATWIPNVKSLNASRSVVIAKPCSTTIYRIEITDPNSPCGTCIREVLYDTIYVTPWSDTSRIIRPANAVPCLSTLNLDYNAPTTCSHIGFNDYEWVDPNGHPYTGKTQSIPGVYSSLSGEWTLRIWNSKKGCHEELKFPIVIGSCCISKPDFTFTGNTNPITFNNTGTGITIHTGTLWSFDDGTTSDQFSPTHTFNFVRDTVINVCLTMLYKDSQGHTCCDRKCKPVPVKANPCAVIADFTFTPVAGAIDEFDFTDASIGSGTLCQYDWEIHDGPPFMIPMGTIPTLRYKFTTPGPWYVCLHVTNCLYDSLGNEIARCSTKICKWIGAGGGLPSQNPSVGIREHRDAAEQNGHVLSVYENPNHGSFTVQLIGREGNYNVIVRDQQGREVYHVPHTFGETPVKIVLSNASAGIYSVEVTNDTEKFTQQISVIR